MLQFDLDKFKASFDTIHAQHLQDLETASQSVLERQNALNAQVLQVQGEFNTLPIMSALLRQGKLTEAQAVRERSIQLALETAQLKIGLAELAVERKSIEVDLLKNQADALKIVKDATDQVTEEILAAVADVRNYVYSRFQAANFDLNAAEQHLEFGRMSIEANRRDLRAAQDQAEHAFN